MNFQFGMNIIINTCMNDIYRPITGRYVFNSEILKKEIDELIKNRAEERTLPFKNGRSIYDPNGLLSIASESDLNDTTRYYLNENQERVPIIGKFKTYHVFNLTYLPEEPESLIDIYKKDDPKKTIFWHKYKKPFTWRNELLSTEIKKSVEQLPLEYIQCVRLIYMSPPSIGQIHVDSHYTSNVRYYKEGFASISFNIDHGEGTLNYLDRKGAQHSVDNNIKIFHFDDSAPHGVTPIKKNRYQLRIWGKLAIPYEDLF